MVSPKINIQEYHHAKNNVDRCTVANAIKVNVTQWNNL